MDKHIGKIGLREHDTTFSGLYRAKVISNADPLNAGRIKVQAYPMFAEITDPDILPWAVPMSPIWDGAGDDIGHFAVPKVDSFVFVMFEGEDVYQPVYIGEAPTATKGLPAELTTNYPNRKVVKSTSGITFIVDDTDVHIRVNHPTGTYVLVNTDGDIIFNPNSTHRTEINAFSRTTKWSLGGPLNGDDGGVIFFVGPLVFNLPFCTSYPGMEYIFVRMDADTRPATVLGIIATPTQIEPNPLPLRLIVGLYSKLHLVSGGFDTGMWHEL